MRCFVHARLRSDRRQHHLMHNNQGGSNNRKLRS